MFLLMIARGKELDKIRLQIETLVLVFAFGVIPFQQDAPSAYDKCRWVTTRDLLDSQAPKFASYGVRVSAMKGRPKVDFSNNPNARMFQTLLRRAAAQGPNFAGHYRVAIWGCGTSCATFAIINLETGRVIWPKAINSVSYDYFALEDKGVFPESTADGYVFGFRKDSRLLVILGDRNQDEGPEGAFYFILENEDLRLIHSTIVKRDCDKFRE